MATEAQTVEVPAIHRQPSYSDEKHDARDSELGGIPPEERNLLDDHDASQPFPIDPDAPEETHQLTVRAVLVGSALGCVVGASNIYLGLKTGFTFGPQLFGAIFGFAILKAISTSMPVWMPHWFFGGPFGPKENCTAQSAATAAGGLGILFVSAVPAMYRLDLLSNDPADDFGKLIALNVACGFFGIFFVIPLRKYYIIHMKLTFPTPAATAYTIRSLHNSVSGAVAAKKKSLALGWSFIIVFVYKVMTGYAPGIIYDWHIGWTLYRIGFTSIISLENYGWFIEFTPAFFGAGMLSGLNASWSFMGGAVLAWGIIAPSLISTGKAVGIAISEEYPLVSYQGLNFEDTDQYVEAPSPRYWLLWPGVLMMLVYSFVDLGMSMIPMAKDMLSKSNGMKMNLSVKSLISRRTEIDPSDSDQTPLEDRVPFLWWALGLIASIIVSVAILATQFDLNVGEGILSLVLAFLFSFIAVQSSGATDINPVSTVAKASQLVYGGVTKGQGLHGDPAMLTNLIGGAVAGGAAAQASDMCGDLKTGYLLRAKPKNQFIAQFCGSVVAVFLSSGLFILFTKAAPCIIHPDESGKCIYGAPSVSAWAAVAFAVTADRLPIPPSSGYTAIGLSILAAISVVIKHLWIPQKYWVWVPNWNSVGLAFVVPQVYYPIAMAAGSVFNWYWERRSPKTYDMYMFPISAGMLAGEGLGGVFQALLAVCGVDGGSGYGTAIGCPGMEFCG